MNKQKRRGSPSKTRSPNKGPQLISGPISIHPKGFGFVRCTEGPDLFIPKHLTMDAVDGDLVEAEVKSSKHAKGPEGAVVAILKRSRTHLAGIVVGKSGRHFTAYSPLLGIDKLIIIRKAEKALKEGDRVICKVSNWNNDLDLVEASLDRYLGHISDPSIDIAAAIHEFELPDGFSKEALEEARQYGKVVPEKELQKRRDLTQMEIVTIDPDTARDFDDAISLTKDGEGRFLLGVHIADVAHYVKPDTHLDREARMRCNSTYLPGTCIPMLPEELSNELCSLKPNVVRLTQSVFALFDPKGDLLNVKIERSFIKSAKRFTYTEALEVLEKKKKSPHAPLLHRMVELCHLLKKKRMERGSIDFAMPDDVIRIDEKGVPIKIERVEYDVTHQMIEEFMLKANELVAVHLHNRGKSLIFRVHEEPSSDSFQDFYSFARALGFKLPPNPKHKDLQRLFQEAKGSPFVEQLSVSFIRSMRLAQYSKDNIGHYGLALEHYCHFTSPIRRYTDLIIQRLLFDELSLSVDLEGVAIACSERERVSMKAEGSVKTLKKLRLAGAHFQRDPGEIYSAVITRIKPFHLFFEVPTFDIESSFHISQIGNDFYEYNPTKMSFRGVRTGKTLSLGDKIEVRLGKIDYILQKSDWVFVPPPQQKKKKKR